MKTTAAILRTFASKPFVVVTDVGPVKAYASKNDARAEAYRMAQYDRPRVVDLSDVDGFCEAASNAGDGGGVLVASLARGETMREIGAGWCHLPILQSRTIPPRRLAATKIRELIGSLSRAKARRQVAAWILEGAVG